MDLDKVEQKHNNHHEAHCPVCGSQRFKPIPFYDHEQARVVCRDTDYHWRLCMNCGNGYPSRQASLEALQHYWNRNRIDSEQAIPDEIWEQRFRNSQLYAQRAYDFIIPHTQSGQKKLLDIGCGLGATIALFQEKGWEAEGVDPDPNIRFFHRRLNVDVVTGQIEQVDNHSKFDVISISHAIYFITEPVNFVQRVKAMLLPEGMFHIVISDFLSSFSDSHPGFAHHWYPTAGSLIYLLEQEGYHIIVSRHHKGSFMLLAKPGSETQPVGRPLWTYFAHMTHQTRYSWFGKPVRNAVAGVKKMLRR